MSRRFTKRCLMPRTDAFGMTSTADDDDDDEDNDA